MTNFRLWAVLGALIALVCLVGWGRHGYALADRWKAHSAIEAANHRQTKANYRAAQLVATAVAHAARIETERRSAALAKEADHANEQAALWADRARRFAAAGGLRSPGRAGADRAAGGTGAASETHAAQGSDGSGTVTLSREDFDALSENTERLLRVHDWGERLMAEGLAVKIEQ